MAWFTKRDREAPKTRTPSTHVATRGRRKRMKPNLAAEVAFLELREKLERRAKRRARASEKRHEERLKAAESRLRTACTVDDEWAALYRVSEILGDGSTWLLDRGQAPAWLGKYKELAL